MFAADIKILIIDDMRTMRKVVQKSCMDLGFRNFAEAEDGAKALEVLKVEKIGLIISDWNMPVMSS